MIVLSCAQKSTPLRFRALVNAGEGCLPAAEGASLCEILICSLQYLLLSDDIFNIHSIGRLDAGAEVHKGGCNMSWIDGKIAIVTGGTQGLGAAIARQWPAGALPAL